MFQSTPPQGGRPSNILHHYDRQSFNPRPHKGGDSIYYNILNQRQILLIAAAKLRKKVDTSHTFHGI